MKRLTTKIDDTYTCSYCENQEAVNKLGMLEDFLEETGIMDLSELKQILTTNIVWQQNEQLKDKWQKILSLIKEIEDKPFKNLKPLYVRGYKDCVKKIKREMQELEKDDE